MGSASVSQKLVNDLIANNKIMVFSKTTCGFCAMVKKLFDELDVPYKVLEINNRNDCSKIQDILERMTGARTVPRVFINGKFVGGADKTKALHRQGKLIQLIEE